MKGFGKWGFIVAFAASMAIAQSPTLLSKELASAPKDAWVPVVMLKDPNNANSNQLMLGLAQVGDIVDGLPYKIGVFQLSSEGPVPGSTVSLSAGQMTLTPVCQSGATASSVPNRCQQLVGVLGANTQLSASYRLGPLQFNGGIERSSGAYAQALNPYLPWPTQSSLVLGQGNSRTQTTLRFSSALDSKFGQFGLGIANTQNSIFGTSDRQLNFNWSGSSFGGSLTAHNVVQNDSSWTGFDLGLSWRAPWRGVFSVGARNVVGKPPALLDRDRAANEAIDTERVPYIRYEQDL